MANSRRKANPVNAGSMADIAFLLLIFFLVTTTIDADKGILVILPPYEDISAPPPPLAPRNVISILVNAENKLLFEKKPLAIPDLKNKVKTYILNKNKDADKPRTPTRAIISLMNDRSTSYETYVAVYDQIKAAYRELRNERSLVDFNLAYNALPKEHKKIINNKIPMVISEAESTDYSR